ncbi:MAG: FAD-dependent oxidoreductase [Anaerolineae bacterium]|jgi:thioredoxin reductase (NADPH)|nr:FAD-dependent oxidoreductase [Anaerolineae bacterium]
MFEFNLGTESPAQSRLSGGVYDVIIVGAGPAGMAAAIYTARDAIRTLVLDKAATGGLGALTERVENYPGFPDGISGVELMGRFRKQAERFGAEFVEHEEVTRLESVERGLWRVTTKAGNSYEGRVVMLATGSKPKKLNVPGEDAFYGRGLSYCATCDGPLFKGKDVVIVGCGNSGLQEGLNVMNYARSVKFVMSRSTSPAEKTLQERVLQHGKGMCYFNHRVVGFKGEERLTTVMTENVETGEVSELHADGVFVYAGYVPDTQFVAGLVALDEVGHIKTDAKMRTDVGGILAIGDVRADTLAQYTVAVGDGTKAAFTARDYLAELKGEAAK